MASAINPSQSMPLLYASRSISQSFQNSVQANNATFWPPKYLAQREPILEIPKPCVERLLVTMDLDMDGRISREELHAFARKSNLTFITPDVVNQMFEEIANRRPLVHTNQLENPINLEELNACCISRYKYL